MNEAEYAWAAGFFDGEGTTCVHLGRPRLSGYRPKKMRLSIGQKDPRVLKKFLTIMHLGRVRGPYTTGNRYTYTLWGEDCLVVLTQMWPYLSEIKKEQAQRVMLAIAEQERLTKE
jgi:hypothetical protein